MQCSSLISWVIRYIVICSKKSLIMQNQMRLFVISSALRQKYNLTQTTVCNIKCLIKIDFPNKPHAIRFLVLTYPVILLVHWEHRDSRVVVDVWGSHKAGERGGFSHSLKFCSVPHNRRNIIPARNLLNGLFSDYKYIMYTLQTIKTNKILEDTP